MPNEPEREIEKKLKAYAKERGDAADTVLHPATRRLLLDEAAEAYPPGRAAEKPRNWRWYFSWPQLAPAFGVVLLLAMASFFMWPSHPAAVQLASNRELSRRLDSDFKSKALVVANRLRNYEAVDALKESAVPQSTPAPASVISKDAKVPVTLDDNVQAIASARPQPSTPPMVSPMPQSPAPVTQPGIYVTNSIGYASAPAGATVSGTIPGGLSREPTDVTYDLAAVTRIRDFVALKSTTTKPANAARVLRKFRVEQSGDVLRIIDGDGSVYVGNWLSATAADVTKTESMTFGKSPDRSLQQREGVDVLTAPEVTTESGRQATIRAVDVATLVTTNVSLGETRPAFGGGVSNQFFRVIGTNLSSKQKVIFNGWFETDPTKLNLGVVSAEKPASKEAGKADEIKWLTGQISGDATVGSNVFKVLAKPADRH